MTVPSSLNGYPSCSCVHPGLATRERVVVEEGTMHPRLPMDIVDRLHVFYGEMNQLSHTIDSDTSLHQYGLDATQDAK
ncbi:hypothetical protein NM688_g9072 [Phlebia brevispora]|uniref:Uncharacterized protein n=1 Tax=Phlebia brevispora TaxID=194682 RepID=A0ACC1RL53_9APHY|nr:hypothetical protein NM688_g9072 [Phlebia brevispora]